MLKNHLRTAIKLFLKNRMYSAINIIGLTVGLCACMIVATVVIDDLSYDKQWKHSKDLYRIVGVNKMGEGLYDRSASSFAGLAPELKKTYPEVETWSQLYSSGLRLKFNEAESNGVEITALHADTTAWNMIDILPVLGNPKHYVDGSRNLLVSENFRNQFFPGQDPVGKIIYDVPAYQEKPNAYLITGVIKNLPTNSHLRADVIVMHKGRIEALQKQQYGTFSQNYILMLPGTNMQQFTSKINKWYSGFVTATKPYQFEFQPIKDVYLHSDFAGYQTVRGSIQNIYIFSAVAILLLLIACINFINLSTARAASRVRETGVRKILGASRNQIIVQFLSEAILFFICASILALLLYQLALKPVEIFLGHPLAQTFVSHFSLLAASFSIIFLVSLFTGIYPAWLMSGFKPAGSLKGKLFSNNSYGQNWLRKSLVVLQFSISIAVLIAMIVVQQQTNMLQHKDVGFNKDNLLNIAAVSWDGKGTAFKNEIAKISGVDKAVISSWLPGNGGGFMSREVDDPNHGGNKITVWYIAGEPSLAAVLGLKLQNGRMLSTDYGTDAMNEDSLMQSEKQPLDRAAVVTASTAKMLHIGKLNNPVANVNIAPVGIVADFHNESFRKAMGPLVIIASRSMQYGGMLIRTKPGAEKQVMASVQQLWKQFYPGKLLDMNSAADMMSKQYESEGKLQQLFSFFSLLTMLLAALGVFGLVVHAAGLRIKEIGVRKVLGASVPSIVRLLSSDFIKLVLISILIASPIAWYCMNKWLQDFAYKINISWWIFAVAGGTAVFIALVTVSFQAVKAAMVNPVRSLRTE